MNNLNEAVDTYFEMLSLEEGIFTQEEKKLYNVFLDGLSLKDHVSVHARKNGIKQLFSVIQHYLENCEGKLVLDAGCGIGNQSFMFFTYWPP